MEFFCGEGPVLTIVLVREGIETVEDGNADEIILDDADSPRLLGKEVVWRWNLSTSWDERSLPVGPLPREDRFDGGKLRAWRKRRLSSSSSKTRCSKA